MQILVLGGSYFYGRVFTMLAAKKHEITVLNRGTYSMESFGVKQIKGDRHDDRVKMRNLMRRMCLSGADGLHRLHADSKALLGQQLPGEGVLRGKRPRPLPFRQYRR